MELQVSGRLPNGEFIGKKSRDEAQKILLNNTNFCDKRNYGIVYKILKELHINHNKYILITDSESKIKNLSKFGLNVIKYDDYLENNVTPENASEYLVKIENLNYTFDDSVINKLIKIIGERNYNERTLATLISIVDKIENDKSYLLDEKIKKKIISVYKNIICGENRRYILGTENRVKIQNNFSAKVDQTIFKIFYQIYGKDIFDRIALEKMYYFQNKDNSECVRIRNSKVIDTVASRCKLFKGQTYTQQSTYDSTKKKVVQKEISTSKFRSFFENPQYDYVKCVEMVTMISEDIIPGVNIYIKRLPSVENRVLDIFGDAKNIEELINKITKLNSDTLLNFVNDEQLSESDFSKYNLRFADLNSVLEEELNIYQLTKGE